MNKAGRFPKARNPKATGPDKEGLYTMKRTIAGLIAGLVLGTAGIATAAGGGNPLEGIQEQVDAIVGVNDQQDAQIAALQARDQELAQAIRREAQLRRYFDRWLAQCGKLGFRDWRFNGRRVFGPVDTEQVFHCFRDARQNARWVR